MGELILLQLNLWFSSETKMLKSKMKFFSKRQNNKCTLKNLNIPAEKIPLTLDCMLTFKNIFSHCFHCFVLNFICPFVRRNSKRQQNKFPPRKTNLKKNSPTPHLSDTYVPSSENVQAPGRNRPCRARRRDCLFTGAPREKVVSERRASGSEMSFHHKAKAIDRGICLCPTGEQVRDVVCRMLQARSFSGKERTRASETN